MLILLLSKQRDKAHCSWTLGLHQEWLDANGNIRLYQEIERIPQAIK